MSNGEVETEIETETESIPATLSRVTSPRAYICSRHHSTLSRAYFCPSTSDTHTSVSRVDDHRDTNGDIDIDSDNVNVNGSGYNDAGSSHNLGPTRNIRHVVRTSQLQLSPIHVRPVSPRPPLPPHPVPNSRLCCDKSAPPMLEPPLTTSSQADDEDLDSLSFGAPAPSQSRLNVPPSSIPLPHSGAASPAPSPSPGGPSGLSGRIGSDNAPKSSSTTGWGGVRMETRYTGEPTLDEPVSRTIVGCLGSTRAVELVGDPRTPADTPVQMRDLNSIYAKLLQVLYPPKGSGNNQLLR